MLPFEILICRAVVKFFSELTRVHVQHIKAWQLKWVCIFDSEANFSLCIQLCLLEASFHLLSFAVYGSSWKRLSNSYPSLHSKPPDSHTKLQLHDRELLQVRHPADSSLPFSSWKAQQISKFHILFRRPWSGASKVLKTQMWLSPNSNDYWTPFRNKLLWTNRMVHAPRLIDRNSP